MAESLSVDRVMNALRNCYDPEIPINIVDLGLIYNVAIVDDIVKVRMTLTTQGCPAHAYLMHQVESEIERIPGVKKAEVDIVWEPAWTPERMSPEGKEQLQLRQTQEELITIEFNRNTYKPRKKGHVAKTPEGKVVLINEANGRYLGNEDIAEIWHKSNGERTIDEIVREIAREKNLSPVEIRDQLFEMVTQLISIGLLYPEQATSTTTLPLHQ
jgi:metal-sulfur cluster biosynthetic enzyme